MHVEQADIYIGIHPKVLSALVKSMWDDARQVARAITEAISKENITYQIDGIAIQAGESWYE